MSKTWIPIALTSLLVAGCSSGEHTQKNNTSTAASTIIAPEDVAVVDFQVPTPLTPDAGDAQRGAGVMSDRKRGNCVACHQVPALKDVPFQGNVGPSLDGAGNRWQEGQLRALVTNPKTYFPNTAMPAYYRTEGLNRVRQEFAGKPILTAQEVEDVIAFLKTLRTGDNPQ